MSEGDRRVFAWMSVFSDGTTLSTAETVFGRLDNCPDVFDALESLVDTSLLRFENCDGSSRFWMLETIREFAKARLSERPERERLLAPYAEYYANLVEEAAPHLIGPDQVPWFGDPDAGDLHKDQAAALAREVGDPFGLVFALIWSYATTGGHFYNYDPEHLLEEAIQVSTTAQLPWFLAHAHNGLGDLLRVRGEMERSRTHYIQALEAFRELKDRWLEAWTLWGLGKTFSNDAASAIRCLSDALLLFRQIGDSSSTVMTLGDLASAVLTIGWGEAAAVLVGSYQHLRKVHLPPLDKPLVDESEAEALRKDWPDAWNRGAAFSLDQIVRFALETSEDALPIFDGNSQ